MGMRRDRNRVETQRKRNADLAHRLIDSRPPACLPTDINYSTAISIGIFLICYLSFSSASDGLIT